MPLWSHATFAPLYKVAIMWLLIYTRGRTYCQGFVHANAAVAHTRTWMIFMLLADAKYRRNSLLLIIFYMILFFSLLFSLYVFMVSRVSSPTRCLRIFVTHRECYAISSRCCHFRMRFAFFFFLFYMKYRMWVLGI